MEDRDDGASAFEFNPSISESVLMGITLLYTLRRASVSSTPSINFIKGRLRSIGAWLTKFSVIFAFAYLTIFSFLNSKLELNKSQIELTKAFDGKYLVDFKKYSLDLVLIMIYSLKLSEILFISAIFIIVSLCEHGSSDQSEFPGQIKSSIASFSKLWAFSRIIIFLYLDTFSLITDQKTLIFFRELIAASELTVATIFLIIIKAKFNSPRSTTENLNLICIAAFFYTVSKHIVNLVDFPFALDPIHLQIISTLQIGLLMSLYLLLICQFCPIKKSILDDKEAENFFKASNTIDDSECKVALVNSVIEFDEKSLKN